MLESKENISEEKNIQLSYHPKTRTLLPNVVVEQLTLLLPIRGVPFSNLDPETCYPD
jgi:hypothetical protein